VEIKCDEEAAASAAEGQNFGYFGIALKYL